MPPDYVVMGTLTKDLIPGGYTVGGTVTYGALTARNLGCSVGIVTSFAPELDPGDLLVGISVARTPSPETTTFENIYVNGQRQQFIHAVATSLEPASIPGTWKHSPIVHLGPLVNEIPSDVVGVIDSRSLIGVTPQGWMRQWDEVGYVEPRRWQEAEAILHRADVLVFSEEDVAHMPGEIQRLAGLAHIMVVTKGPAGATLYLDGQATHHPAFEAEEVDPTGAGDVFAAAFLIRLRETEDPHEATRFAHATASLTIEGLGVHSIPTREQVEHRLRHGRIRSIPHE